MVNRLKLNEKTLRDAELRPGVSYQIVDTEVIALLIGSSARLRADAPRSYAVPSTRGATLWQCEKTSAKLRA